MHPRSNCSDHIRKWSGLHIFLADVCVCVLSHNEAPPTPRPPRKRVRVSTHKTRCLISISDGKMCEKIAASWVMLVYEFHLVIFVFFKRLFFLAILFLLLIGTAEERQERWERERGWHAAKGPGLESNPGRCDKDTAFMVRTLPGELPWCPKFQLSSSDFYVLRMQSVFTLVAIVCWGSECRLCYFGWVVQPVFFHIP